MGIRGDGRRNQAGACLHGWQAQRGNDVVLHKRTGRARLDEDSANDGWIRVL